MSTSSALIATIAGLAALAAGAELLVRGGGTLARRLGVSPLVVGLTVVAFGTSAPELVVSVRASWDGLGAIAIGNVVGSNIANIGLILGLAGLLQPLAVHARVIRFEIPLVIAVSAIGGLACLGGSVSRIEGGLLLAGLALWLVWTVRAARREGRAPEASDAPLEGSWTGDFVRMLAGLTLLAGGAEALVRGATAIARSAQLSDAVIGLTLVAVGTSLPELATTIAAARRGESDLAIGNVVGSNLFNVLGILGGAALVRPLLPAGISVVDLGVMTLAAVALLPLAASGKRLSRTESAMLLVGYAAYVVLRATVVG
jgi:cation:H+ antiporter